MAESTWLLNDIVFVCRNLPKWVKDEKAEDIDLTFKFTSPKIRKDPLGCVLVIGYVFPFRFSFLWDFQQKFLPLPPILFWLGFETRLTATVMGSVLSTTLSS